MSTKASDIIRELRRAADTSKVADYQRFFKTGPGQYGEGDVFLGVSVPKTRAIIRGKHTLALSEIEILFRSRYHEARLAACLLLVARYEHAPIDEKTPIYDFYLRHSQRINNWDLVDVSSPRIVGRELLRRGDWSQLLVLARSENLWERRIAVLATAAFIEAGDSQPIFMIATMLLNDSHDLIHKAVGWMLREVGKRISQAEEERFLREDHRYKKMPRTMLRYAIERFDPALRQAYLSGEI